MHHISKLKNGITLITVPVNGTKATTVLAMFPVGSRYEHKKISGASHFVEHMLFKGTKKRPTAQDISKTLDAAGADYNAFTYKDYTGYYVKIDGAKQELAFDLLSDIIFNSAIASEEVEKEKGAIIEEIHMYDDSPMNAVDLLADDLIFEENSLGWNIAGSADIIRAMTREELWEYYQKHYSAKNMVLVVAGNVDKKRLKKLLPFFEKQSSPKQATTPAFYKKNFPIFEWPTDKRSFAERTAAGERKVDQASVLISFPGLKNNHPDRFALSILLNILGGGMSSRLFVEVREKRGLAYMVRAGSASFRDTGMCYVQAGLDPARLSEAVTVIKAELQKIKDEPVSVQELKNAQSNMAGRMALAMEDSSAQAEWFAKQFLFATKIQTPDEVVRQLKKVTIKQVQKVAKQLLDWDQLRFAMIGPMAKEKVLEVVK